MNINKRISEIFTTLDRINNYKLNLEDVIRESLELLTETDGVMRGGRVGSDFALFSRYISGGDTRLEPQVLIKNGALKILRDTMSPDREISDMTVEAAVMQACKQLEGQITTKLDELEKTGKIPPRDKAKVINVFKQECMRWQGSGLQDMIDGIMSDLKGGGYKPAETRRYAPKTETETEVGAV